MNVYPLPHVDPIVIEVTAVPVIEAVASALKVVPRPTGLATVTVGAIVYPTPAVVISKEEIVPNPDTCAVAAAPIESSCEYMFIVASAFGTATA